jgi:hypothetical protein
MARREALRISLFPFMSVLACTIGVLVMLLVAMSLASVGASRSAELSRAASKESREADTRAIAEETALVDRAEALWSKVDAGLEAHGLAPGLSATSIARLLEKDHEGDQLVRSLEEIEAERRALEKDRDKIETTIEVLQSRRTTLPILIDPTGLSRRFEPYFIECDADGATLYRATDDYSYFVPKEDLSANGDFGRYQRRVKAMPGALVVLLVRPDGIDTYNRAETVLRNADIRVASLPLPGQGKLDWSLLRQAEGQGE